MLRSPSQGFICSRRPSPIACAAASIPIRRCRPKFRPARTHPMAPSLITISRPAVAPGEYNVKLTVNGKSDSRMLVVRMDPRVSVAPAALQQQFDVELQIGDALRQDHAALQQLRRLRAQIKDLRDRTRKPSVES